MVEIKKRTEVADSCSCSTIGTTDVDMLKPQNVSHCVLAHLHLQPSKGLGMDIFRIVSAQALFITNTK